MLKPGSNFSCYVGFDESNRFVFASSGEHIDGKHSIWQFRQNFQILLHPPTDKHLTKYVGVVLQDFVAHVICPSCRITAD
jgi:hypothetical protein